MQWAHAIKLCAECPCSVLLVALASVRSVSLVHGSSQLPPRVGQLTKKAFEVKYLSECIIVNKSEVMGRAVQSQFTYLGYAAS